MREILFRGKEKDQWISGYYWKFEKDGKEIHVIRDTPDKLLKFNHIVELETVGQFTGFLDIDGCKIFEGDIVKAISEMGAVGRVYYDDKKAKFRIKTGKIKAEPHEYISFINFSDYGSYKVIGNIFDNPELLK